MTPKQRLLAHMAERHRLSSATRRLDRLSLADLQRAHAWDHHRLMLSHHHGATTGPGDRPPGWRTGDDVQERT